MSGACPELGFEVALEAAPGSSRDLWARMASRLEQELAAEGLVWQGMVRGARWHLTFQREGGQATEADRQRVRAWAEAQPELVRRDIGPLVDLG